MSGWPAALSCGCPSAGLVAIDTELHDAYHREIGGPATCFRLCWCRHCPQYPQQKAALAVLIEQERGQRIVLEGRRIAARRTAA